jgi:hypothetical protein
LIGGLAGLVPAKRSAEDIFAGRIRVELGGTTYILPVRSRKSNREWLEALDAATGAALDALDTIDDTGAVLRLLTGMDDAFLDALVSYDETGALPSRDEIDAQATDMEVTRAIVEVWLAANPKVAIALGLVDGAVPSERSSPTPPAPSAGPPVSSRAS